MTSAPRLLPVVALIGRPNVGKSTLFNRLTRSRAALVADLPGLTRDRQYGRGRLGAIPFIVVDTGGFEPDSKTGVSSAMARQTRQAIVEADRVFFLVDGRDGLVPHDRDIATELRRIADKVVLVVNKTEGMPRAQVAAEFHELGLGEPIAVSSAHGDGVAALVEHALAAFAAVEPDDAADPDGSTSDAPEPGGASAEPRTSPSDALPVHEPRRVSIAVIGRPNVGKSTLVNTLLGEERMVAFDQPGTTRDAVSADFDHRGKRYTLIDTAGVRRRARVSDFIEKFSVVKTLQAIEASNVCVLLLDAVDGINEQDTHLAGYIMEAGRALVVAINKWDTVDREAKERLRTEYERRFHFLSYARVHHVSALKGQGIGALLRSADDAFAAAVRKLPTPKLTRALQEAVSRQEPPRKGNNRPKLRYAHQGGQNPPIIVIHGNSLGDVPSTYRRYLEGWFRREFELEGTPLRIEFKSGSNPYAARR